MALQIVGYFDCFFVTEILLQIQWDWKLAASKYREASSSKKNGTFSSFSSWHFAGFCITRCPGLKKNVFRFNAEEMISINPLILLHCQVPDIPQGRTLGLLECFNDFSSIWLPLRWVCICDPVWRKKSFELTNNVVVLTEARTRQFGIVDLWR